jgi:predicted RNA binding protein YcfA (HicA-like mRNA interferase family)
MTIKRGEMERYLFSIGFKRQPGGRTSHIKYTGPGGIAVTLPGHGRPELSGYVLTSVFCGLARIGIDRRTVRQALAR